MHFFMKYIHLMIIFIIKARLVLYVKNLKEWQKTLTFYLKTSNIKHKKFIIFHTKNYNEHRLYFFRA